MKNRKKKMQHPNNKIKKVYPLLKLILVWLSYSIPLLAFCQEKKHLLQQHDPYEANKYYFSLLPSAISKIILQYYSQEFRTAHHFEFILSPIIDKALVMGKISDAAFWGSFNMSLYENSLFRTAFSGGNSLCTHLYLGRGKHPTSSRGQYEYNSPLSLSVSFQHSDVVGILLNAGADPNYQECKNSDYPLCIAAEKNNFECVRLLLAKGANKGLEIALQWAVRNNSTEIVKLLLVAGVDPNNNVGQAAIIEAAMLQHNYVLQVMLDHGAKIYPNRHHMRSALYRAHATGNTALVILLENGGVELG